MTEPLSINRVRVWQRAALAASLLLYLALVARIIPRHEPWADEAQAWQMARSTGLIELFRTAIHYEFSPGLWHGLLWLLVRLHLPYAGLPWVSAAIALSGVCLILFASPLPLALRVLLPFTYFFAFQYAVVARSYVLFAPILFLIAVLWHRRRQHPLLLALLLGLLANISVHGLITAIGLVLILAIEQWQRRRERPAERRARISAITTIAITVLTALILFALWCIIPPPDADWLRSITTAAHRPASNAAQLLVNSRHPLQRVPQLLRFPIGALRQLLHILSFGIAQPREIACLAWLLLFWRWWREKRLRYAVPVLLLAGFCVFSRFDTYHAGLLWVLLLFLWWVTWPEDHQDPRQSTQRSQGIQWAQRLLIVLFAFFIACQIAWTARAVRYDLTQAYSPDRAAAPLLRRYLAEGKQVDIALASPAAHAYGGYFAVGLEPYFAVEPFHDAEARYWIWRPHPAEYSQYVRDTEAHSVVVLLEQLSPDPQAAKEQRRLASLGYRQDAAVCGRTFYPLEFSPRLCHVFYVPN